MPAFSDVNLLMQRNFIVFVILAILLMGGWFWMISSMQTSKDGDKDKVADLDKGKKKEDDKPKPEEKKKPKDEKPPEIEKKKDTPPPLKNEPAKTETLGGAEFHLSVDITTRGAGVRRVVLNRFKAADWRGRPTDRELEIIQDDEFSPSFRMYHYENPGDDNPVFGLGEKIWTFEGKEIIKDDEGEVKYQQAKYSTTVPGLKHVSIVKTYRLAPKDYHVTLLLELVDTRKPGDEPTQFRYQLVGGLGLPIEGEWYTATFRNSLIGLVDKNNDLWRKLEDSLRISQRKGGDTWPDNKLGRGDNLLQYAGTTNQYFGVIILPDNEQPKREAGGTTPDKILAWARPTHESVEKRGHFVKIDAKEDAVLFRDDKNEARRYRLLPRTKRHIEDLGLLEGDVATLSVYETPEGEWIASWVRLGTTLKPQFDDITMRVNSEKIELLPGRKVAHQFMLYHGPVKAALLGQFGGDKEVPDETVNRYTHTLHLRTLTDYPSDNWFGWISSKIMLTNLIILVTRFMHSLFHLLHYVFGYGLSIVILTVIVRGAMFPISRKQALFSIKMQELAPELKKIQDKYPDDPQARMQATQEFYRKHGINPLGSCWPIFLQMPIFLGLYFALQESIHFRLAGFVWIESLAAPDMLLYWSESIPIISSPDSATGFLGALYLGPYLNILPVIAVVFMMIQQMQTMPPPTDEQQAMQQKMLKFMSIFFGIMFYKVAAGLCIYFISSSLWGMAERKLLPKKQTSSGVASGGVPPAAQPQGPMTPKWKGKSKKDKEAEKEKTPVTTLEKLKALWREILKAAEKK